MINLLKKSLELFELEDNKKVNIIDSYIGSILLTYKKYNESDKNIVLYASNAYEANRLFEGVSSFVDKDKIVLLPSNELIRVDYISESKELKSEFIYGLYKIRHEKHLVIIATTSNVFRFLPRVELFDDSFISLKVGDKINLTELKDKLIRLGYIRVSKIDQSLEFAFRGGVIDVFSLNYDDPIRIELFDDEVESIRKFKIDTQLSFEKMDECLFIPATVNLLSNDELNKAKNKILFQLENDLKNISEEDKDILKGNVEESLEEILNGDISNKNYKYYGFLQNIHASLADYLDDSVVILSSVDDFFNSKNQLIKESNDFLFELQTSFSSISRLEYFNARATIFPKKAEVVRLNQFFLSDNDLSVPLRPIQDFKGNDKNARMILEFYLNNSSKILVLYKSQEEKEKIVNVLDTLQATYSLTEGHELNFDTDVSLSRSMINLSFEFSGKNIVVISSETLLGEKSKFLAYSTKFKEGKIIESLEELEPGDFVVHEKYGIGKFSKIETIEVEGKHNDYIEILYANNDKLYIPLYQFNLIRKYVGKEGTVPKLNHLGTKAWEKTKKKIKERINDLADRLLELYQSRAKIEGFAFEKDDDIQKSFEISFHHDLTEDQSRCVEEIKKDMEKPIPMDRLLCGDVGFGKTEVALEVAMKAILSGKQVCFLCPTTLLAMQHFKVAKERFKDFPVRIEVLTRMNTKTNEHDILESLKQGRVDLLIGTHKVLSRSILFKDLGLLIIDEEQRFGVEQKEKIKERYKNIDVLTLSATPIPRTLQSSLVGLKSISTIETAPKGRIPIQTYVINYDEKVIKEIIQRELGRKGQVYYLYNDISELGKKALMIQNLVTEAKIGIIHAKMNKNDIDEIMTEFYEHKIDILLATTIIENGIDVPNANLLLVENADRFGLAQLYQIKGRVGRGDRMAFAYLMIKKNRKMTDEAKKRLKAIQDFTELGSGYKIAQRDLLIRGAGDILGPEQAGFVDSVGIDMYIRLLNDAIKEKRGETVEEFKNIKSLNTIDGYIPEEFAKVDEKLEIYQKILEVNSITMLNELKNTIKDQYGKLPKSVASLFVKRAVDIYLSEEEFKSYNEYPRYIKIVLDDKFSSLSGIGTSLFTALIRFTNKIKLSYRDKLINIEIEKKEDWVITLIEVLKIIHKVYLSQRKAKFVDEDR